MHFSITISRVHAQSARWRISVEKVWRLFRINVSNTWKINNKYSKNFIDVRQQKILSHIIKYFKFLNQNIHRALFTTKLCYIISMWWWWFKSIKKHRECRWWFNSWENRNNLKNIRTISITSLEKFWFSKQAARGMPSRYSWYRRNATLESR